MEKTLRSVLKNNLRVKNGEKVLILTDIHENPTEKQKNINKIAEKAAEIAKEFTKKVILLKYPAREMHNEPVPSSVEAAILGADVVMGITWFSITHIEPSKKASKKGARVATMPTIKLSMLEKGGSVDVDYKLMSERCKKMIELLKGKKQVQILGKDTDLTLSIEGREFEPDDGLFDRGSPGNLPAGEVMGAPVESSANGVISLNVPKAKLTFKDGKVIKFESEDKDLKQKIMKFDHRRVIAELGVGTNPNAKDPENGLEAEKIFGTIHVAVGNNTAYPGGKNKSDIHQDFIMFDPTLIVDGEKLINKGKWLI